MEFQGDGTPLTYEAALDVASDIGVPLERLWAVVRVETSGCGFLADRRPRLLFERHVFKSLTGGRWDATHPGISGAFDRAAYGAAGPHQYARLAEAAGLDQEAALKSASWGLGQVMGFNHVAAGFPTVSALVAAAVESEAAQLLQMAEFIFDNPVLVTALREGEWTDFAIAYNGPSQQGYDARLGRAAGLPLPDFAIRAKQMACMYAGIDVGAVDGVLGPRTRAAFAELGISV